MVSKNSGQRKGDYKRGYWGMPINLHWLSPKRPGGQKGGGEDKVEGGERLSRRLNGGEERSNWDVMTVKARNVKITKGRGGRRTNLGNWAAECPNSTHKESNPWEEPGGGEGPGIILTGQTTP